MGGGGCKALRECIPQTEDLTGSHDHVMSNSTPDYVLYSPRQEGNALPRLFGLGAARLGGRRASLCVSTFDLVYPL